jgi:hypothetical protein
MSVHQVLQAASDAGITLRIDGPDLVVGADNHIPEALLAELREHKPEVIAAFTTRFSDLYETEQDYARALLRYAEQDGLSLTAKDGRLVIAVSSKSDADLLSEIRAYESAVIEAIAAGPSQGFCPTIMKVPPFGCDVVPERFAGAWEALTARCPPGVMPLQWQFALTDAADLFRYWGLQLIKLGFTPGDIFDVPRTGKPGGLAWAMQGNPALALGRSAAQLANGKIWRRG